MEHPYSWVTHSPQFKAEIRRRVKNHPWLSKIDGATECSCASFDFDPKFTDYDCFELHNVLKREVKEAARVARNDLLQAADEGISLDLPPSEQSLALLTSISRAQWSNDIALAKLLLRHHKTAKDHIYISDGVVYLRNHNIFADLIWSHRSTILAKQKTSCDKDLADARGSHSTRVRKLQRKSVHLWKIIRSWSLRGAFISLGGIIEGNTTHTTPESVTSSLISHWMPVFSAAHTDLDLAETLLGDLKDDLCFDWTTALPNSTKSFERSIVTTRVDTGPGEDGIPYSGYHPISRLASRLFSSVNRRIISQKAVPDRHNYTVLNFPPKKPSLFNEHGALVPPDQTRPIGKKNASNKLISKTWAWNVRSVFMCLISWIQRGFVPGRNFLLNVLELDLFSRVFSNCPRSSLPPAILVSFDIMAAFPTLALSWLFRVLEVCNAPYGFLTYVRMMYTDLLHFVQYRGSMTLFGLVTQGVVQGCPLASLLYVLGVHPFSLLFEKHICDPRRGLVRQCADDIGALLKSLSDLPILHWVFNLMALVANQILGFSKCIVVLVTGHQTLKKATSTATQKNTKKTDGQQHFGNSNREVCWPLRNPFGISKTTIPGVPGTQTNPTTFHYRA